MDTSPTKGQNELSANTIQSTKFCTKSLVRNLSASHFYDFIFVYIVFAFISLVNKQFSPLKFSMTIFWMDSSSWKKTYVTLLTMTVYINFTVQWSEEYWATLYLMSTQLDATLKLIDHLWATIENYTDMYSTYPLTTIKQLRSQGNVFLMGAL